MLSFVTFSHEILKFNTNSSDKHKVSFLENIMSSEKETIINFDIEIKKLLKNVDEIKNNIDIYGMLVEEKMLAGV